MIAALWTLIFVLGILLVAFEIWMLVNAAKNQKLSDTEKILWIIGMLLIHPFVAIAYYFIARSDES